MRHKDCKKIYICIYITVQEVLVVYRYLLALYIFMHESREPADRWITYIYIYTVLFTRKAKQMWVMLYSEGNLVCQFLRVCKINEFLPLFIVKYTAFGVHMRSNLATGSHPQWSHLHASELRYVVYSAINNTKVLFLISNVIFLSVWLLRCDLHSEAQ